MMAQKKELSQARTILKSGRGVEQAEQLMTGLLKDSANRDNKRIYAVWYEAVLKQKQAGKKVNDKLDKLDDRIDAQEDKLDDAKLTKAQKARFKKLEKHYDDIED
jgi:hypothetical protein